MERTIEITDYSEESYKRFLHAKKSPIHRVAGNRIHIGDVIDSGSVKDIAISDHLFDYQRFIVRVALMKRRFAVFADVGLGKTAIFLEWVRHVSKRVYPKKTLIITQLHLINQTMEEQLKFYGWTNIMDINAIWKGHLDEWVLSANGKYEGSPVGIINIDKFRNEYRLHDHVGAIVLDESSCLKNETGRIRTNIINACKGIPFKLACTATPAPNDRQEYANHALFLGWIDNFKQFFTKYFFNTGSGNDFILKPHARRAFYEFLATWSIFLKDPSHYGFDDNLHSLKAPDVIWDHVALTETQNEAAIEYAGKDQLNMFAPVVGGIANRTKVSQIAKGFVYDGTKDRK